MYKVILLFLLISIDIIIYSQGSIIPDLGFEDTIQCPICCDINVSSALWFRPTIGTSDHFCNCINQITQFDSSVFVPNNYFGFQFPYDGSCYVGLYLKYISPNYREYLSIQLSPQMEKGKLYQIKFFISLADSCVFASKSIGIKFLNDINLIDTTALIIEENEDVFIESETYWIDKLNWQEVKSYYLANGNEKFLIMGNFRDDNHSEFLQLEDLKYPNDLNEYNGSYYFIDSFFISEVILPQLPNVFSPNGDGVNDSLVLSGYDSDFDQIIYNRWGNVVYSNKATKPWNGRVNDIDASNGIYYISVSLNKFNIKNGFVHLFH